ncbi:MAG: guanylate kinase [Gemmatales bacterium]|nr:guanylate kinase [Gemmatales bacterium]MDW8386267.1 guanylate kinase [Gemmatales bacterium]
MSRADPGHSSTNLNRCGSGRLIVLSGPSGSGKSTVVRKLLEPGDLPIRLSVSATTRPPRPGEVPGRDYWFLDRAAFDQAVAEGKFLEWAEVFGHRYGTLKSEVEPYLNQGIHVLLEIDVQGAEQIRRTFPQAVLVFLRTSSLEEYERRLRARGTEDEAAIRMRLEGAVRELSAASRYDYQIVNDDLDSAVRQFRQLIQSLGGASGCTKN